MKLTTIERKRYRIRKKLKKVSNDRYRLSISRSSKNISAQIIDDKKNITLISASSIDKEIKASKKNKSELSTIVAEKFGQSTGYPTPVIESTGTGGGMKLFCSGIGLEYPDITNASRKIKSGETELCANNGVEYQEFIVGNDGLAFSNSGCDGPLSNTTFFLPSFSRIFKNISLFWL